MRRTREMVAFDIATREAKRARPLACSSGVRVIRFLTVRTRAEESSSIITMLRESTESPKRTSSGV